MNNCRFFVVLGVLVLIHPNATADEAQEKSYLLAPVRTSLQRYVLLASKADAYALVDIDLLEDGKFNENRLDVGRFREDLVTLARQLAKPTPVLQLTYRYSGVFPEAAEKKKLEAKISAICQEAGFARMRTSSSYTTGSWEDELAKFRDLPGDPNAGEDPIDHELVRVYPVRTKLTRSRIGDADCFVVIRQPFDSRFRGFSKSTREAIAECVAKMDLRREPKLVISGSYTTSGEKEFFRFFERKGSDPSPADLFARELGFKSCTWAMATPMGVSPETLLGKQAPDFTLESLSGGEINLHEIIKGRAAVIAFWGVACGGCRVEAPHLTALHERYGDLGLRVIAVNGYDEPKETVSAYVRDNGLTHTIALMGGDVAKGKYTVTSYPVTFFVDHTGKVVDYHLGFDEGDERLLVTRVEQLLREQRESLD